MREVMKPVFSRCRRSHDSFSWSSLIFVKILFTIKTYKIKFGIKTIVFSPGGSRFMNKFLNKKSIWERTKIADFSSGKNNDKNVGGLDAFVPFQLFFEEITN